jgi:tyrosyl-tRNA synthetase
MFGKLMSVSDRLMWRYYLLLTDLTARDVEALQARVESGALHPKTAKVDLARRIVSEFHDALAADRAAAEFDRVHSKGQLPSDLRDLAVDFGGEAHRPLIRLLVDAGLASSTSEAGRKIQQGGVRVNGEKLTNLKHRVAAVDLPLVVQVARRAVRLISKAS